MDVKKNYGSAVERMRPELKEAISVFPDITYDMDGILSQRAGGKFYEEHPEYLPTDPAVKISKKRDCG